MARSRSGFHSRGTVRRKSSWQVGPGDSTPLVFSTSSEDAYSGLNIIADGITLVRTRGSFSAFLTGATASGDGFHCALGIGIVSSQVFGQGVLSMPHPIEQVSWDGWLYHRFFDLHMGDSIGGGGSNQACGVAQFEVDSKAMRKVAVNEVIFAMVEVIENTTATMECYFDSRLLFKLP